MKILEVSSNDVEMLDISGDLWAFSPSKKSWYMLGDDEIHEEFCTTKNQRKYIKQVILNALHRWQKKFPKFCHLFIEEADDKAFVWITMSNNRSRTPEFEKEINWLQIKG